MPGLDRGSVGYDMSGNVAAAVPYCWEAAPGRPISDAVSDCAEPVRAPLPPPPGLRSGVRRPLTFVEPTFGGFEPEPLEVAKSSAPHFAEKLFKKLQTKLRKKSKLLAVSFTVEAIRALTEHRKRTISVEDNAQSRFFCDDSDGRCGGGSLSSSCTFEQPGTPCSSDSVSANSMSSMSSLSNASTSWESIGFPSALHQEGSQRNFDLLHSTSDDHITKSVEFRDGEGEECQSGPRESAWHEDGEDEDELTEQEWQVVRYASLQGDNSSSIATLVRQSSLTPLSDHSYQLSPIKARKSERE